MVGIRRKNIDPSLIKQSSLIRELIRPIIYAHVSKRRFMIRIDPIVSEKFALVRFLISGELITEADKITPKIDSSTAVIAENSKPKVPIRGKKVKTIDVITTIANENTTLLEKSMFSNFIPDPTGCDSDI